MARPSKLTEAQKQEILRLHKQVGVPYTDLALKYEVHRNTILRICEPETYAKHLSKCREYQKENRKAVAAQSHMKQRRYVFTLNKMEDVQIIEHLNSLDNVNQYLKNLVIKDMTANQNAHQDDITEA